ncbi:hypothetical protein FALBO_7175 [Fusarium albosuccineum]|uniref:Fucose-specific lectin n=1 Tax=Fusarium albosuccineum TaxID=1237068 RepID=A0A8H4LAQ8_9HYPO|nr:hypothetical protein FALBO_7175 [Fusarium albosuccineum]
MARSVTDSVLGLFLLAAPASAITGWWTWTPGALTPHFAFQDPASGDLLHSACNSNGTPIFPTDEPHRFNLTVRARAASPIAVTGWYDDDLETTYATVFYQSTDGNLMNGDFTCNWETGDYDIVDEGAYSVSDDAGAASVHEKSGLAVVELGDFGGPRLYYHDKDARVNLIAYDDDTDWRYLGPVSMMEVVGMELAAVQTEGSNVSVVFPHDDSNLAVAQFYEKNKNKWSLSSVPTPFKSPVPTNKTKAANIALDYSGSEPFNLKSFDATTVHLGIASDPDHVLSIFYIGTDKRLREITQSDGEWRIAQGSEDQDWPKADDEAAPLAVISPTGEEDVWIFYQSGDEVIQLQKKNGGWLEATTVPTEGDNGGSSKDDGSSNDSSDTSEEKDTGGSSSSDGATNNDETSNDGGAGLTTGAKAGIGVGVAAGVLLGGAALFMFVRRKKAASPEEKAPAYQPAELAEPTQELPVGNDYRFELTGDTPTSGPEYRPVGIR